MTNQFRSASSYENRFSVFSVRGPNCVRQQIVEIKDSRMTVLPQAQFLVSEGNISGLEVHPSKDYILVTTNRGKIYIFRIDTGELRGKINIPMHA